MALGGLTPYLINLFTSATMERLREVPFRVRQGLFAEAPVVNFFHQIDDPYSYLALEATRELRARYGSSFELTPVRDAALPAHRQEGWQRYRRVDARRVAAAWGMEDLLTVDQPDAAAVQKCLRCYINMPDPHRADGLLDMSRALWTNRTTVLDELWNRYGLATPQVTDAELAAGNARRHALGHYQAGAWNCAGKWYVGLERLHFLESDLTRLGLLRAESSVSSDYFAPNSLEQLEGARLDVFFSLRSPYSYLALDRLIELQRSSSTEIRLRPVLPMVMRGVQLTPEKRNYILLDSARIARRHQIPFGHIRDPLGPGIQKCLALFFYAQQHQSEQALVLRLMRGCWSRGEDLNSDRVLARICKEVGLDWEDACNHRDAAAVAERLEKNRQQLELMGLWGVPTFAIIDSANNLHSVFWGQDRLPWLEYGLVRR